MSDVLVLCYHAVSESWDAALSVTPQALEKQLTTLVERGWRGARFTESVLAPPHRQTLAVTFDDGFLSVLEQAKPILDELDLPATMFVPTAFMDSRVPLVWPGVDQWVDTPFASELESMSWDDLRLLVNAGWEIGSHSRTHPRLTQLEDQDLRHELERSRSECEAQLGQPCVSLAYPYGDVDQRVAEAARSAGYETGASLSSSLASGGTLRWPRLGIYHGDHPWRFWVKMSRAARRVRASRVWPAHE